MFEPLKNILNFFASLDENTIMFEIVRGDRDIQITILDLNRMDQLFDQGIRSDGTLIGLYSPATEAISGGKKKAGTHYTMKDTGEFFRSFRVVPSKTFFEIVADGDKGDENLFDKYGKDLLGLTPESRDKLAEELIPKIQDYIKFKALSL